MPVKAIYKYKFSYNDAESQSMKEVICSAECDIYKFSNPDTFGAVALCYFKNTDSLSCAVPDIDPESGRELSTQHVVGIPNGGPQWKGIDVRFLTPVEN